MPKKNDPAVEKAIETLRGYIPDDQTPVWYVSEKPSAATSHRVRLLVVDKGNIRDVTLLAARACGLRRHEKTGTVVVPGGGVNVGLHVVLRVAGVLGYDKLDARSV